MRATVATTTRGLRGVVEWEAVDVGSSQRFEIELEPQEPKRSRFRHREEAGPAPLVTAPEGFAPLAGDLPPDAVFTPAAPPETGPGSGSGPGERNRLVVTALAAGAVALFVGWSLGRAGGGGDEAAQTGGSAATTAAETEPSAATTVPTGETLPAASLPSTTRPRPTTTTTLPPAWRESQVSVDGRLDGQTDRLVAVTGDGDLLELDLATGTLRTLDTPRRGSASLMPPVAGRDWIAVAFDDGNAPKVYRGDDPNGTTITSVDPWSILWQPASDSLWQQQWDNTGRSEGLVEYALDGSPTGRTIDTRGLWASRIDYTGGFLLGDGSIGSFRVSPDGSQRLADGYVIAAGVNHLLTYACAENFDTCALSVVDRATGESRVVPADESLGADLLTGFWQPPSTPAINVDGTAAIVVLPNPNGPPKPAVLDLVTGEIVWNESSSDSYLSGAWSADGRFAFLVKRGVLIAFDRSGEGFPVSDDPAFAAVTSATVRPV